jgi:hypothetical protein
MPDKPMTKPDRDALIGLNRRRARQAEREAEARERVLLAEVEDLMTAEFEAHDRLWAEAVNIAKDAMAKANAQIQAQCLDLGIPPKHAPGLSLTWHARSSEFTDSSRRAELRRLAASRLAALTKTAKSAIQAASLNVEEQLILGGLQSGEARAFIAAMPTPEQLMPPLSLEDLGVVHWQPPEDAASQLTTPLTTTARNRRRIRRLIVAMPDASDREIARIANVDHKTVAAQRHCHVD